MAALVALFMLNSHGASAAKPAPKDDKMSLEQARIYMVTLINIDRRKSGLAPVALDAIASKAGQLHTDKLLRIGARGHYEPDGSKPPQRYNLCGGTDYVAENAYSMGLCDRTHKVDPKAKFSRMTLYALERGWMNSPKHRDNILDKHHTHVGVGLSQSEDGTTVSAVQEFINKYGNIAKIPMVAYRGQRVQVGGSLSPGYKIRSVDVLREPLPTRMSIAAMNSQSSYSIANNRVTTVFPDKMATTTHGYGAAIEVKENWLPGLYYCISWAEDTRNKEPIPVSMLTFFLQ